MSSQGKTSFEPQSFGVCCKFCGTIAESWPWKFREHAPFGATIGMARCVCGRTCADSSDYPGMGRVLVREPKGGQQ